MYRRFGKRILDLLMALVAVLLLSPVMALTALAVRLDSKGPLFFRQERLGHRGQVFSVHKFRSMTDEPREVRGEIHGGHPDVTRVGRVLRRSKLDELPQLINVLRGEMSLVGPRPCVVELREEFNADGHKRLQVRPGVTGLAQVSGNIHLSWPERWGLDARYVDEHGLWMDLRILAKTVGVVLLGEERFKVG